MMKEVKNSKDTVKNKFPDVELVVLTYPGVEYGWVMRERKIKNFLKNNKEVFEKYNLDISKFKINKVKLQDRSLAKVFLENFPEDFL